MKTVKKTNKPMLILLLAGMSTTLLHAAEEPASSSWWSPSAWSQSLRSAASSAATKARGAASTLYGGFVPGSVQRGISYAGSYAGRPFSYATEKLQPIASSAVSKGWQGISSLASSARDRARSAALSPYAKAVPAALWGLGSAAALALESDRFSLRGIDLRFKTRQRLISLFISVMTAAPALWNLITYYKGQEDLKNKEGKILEGGRYSTAIVLTTLFTTLPLLAARYLKYGEISKWAIQDIGSVAVVMSAVPFISGLIAMAVEAYNTKQKEEGTDLRANPVTGEVKTVGEEEKALIDASSTPSTSTELLQMPSSYMLPELLTPATQPNIGGYSSMSGSQQIVVPQPAYDPFAELAKQEFAKQ